VILQLYAAIQSLIGINLLSVGIHNLGIRLSCIFRISPLLLTQSFLTGVKLW